MGGGGQLPPCHPLAPPLGTSDTLSVLITCLSAYMYRPVHDLIPGNIFFLQNFFRSPNENIASTDCGFFFFFFNNSLQLSADYHYRSIKHRLPSTSDSPDWVISPDSMANWGGGGGGRAPPPPIPSVHATAGCPIESAVLKKVQLPSLWKGRLYEWNRGIHYATLWHYHWDSLGFIHVVTHILFFYHINSNKKTILLILI